ncbi:MAG TPA: serine hydrolase domain-containing protein [Acidimicrobiales bacterium]|nr:serine hydrolase domain-containing protein [Acidimicrobiales bacterium]
MTSGLETVADWPPGPKAAGWVAGDGRTATAGAVAGTYRLASVTKLLSTMGLLVALEEGAVELDEPAGPPGATVRLVLSHASGLPFDGTTPIAPPGTRRIYGNTAFVVLADLLEARTRIPFGDYVAEAVLAPLGMAGTTWGASPAHGARSTVPDLLRLGAELLRPGRIVAPATLAEATTVQLPELRGVLPGFGRHDPNPWGLGFEVHGAKAPHWMPAEASPRAFGHFGQTASFLWVDPDADVACVGLSEEPFGDWARAAWPVLGREVLATVR